MSPPETQTSAASPGSSGAPSAAALATERRLTLVDRVVRAPLGLLYLGFLVVLALPVMLWMTTLYGVSRLRERASTGVRRAPRDGRADVEHGT